MKTITKVRAIYMLFIALFTAFNVTAFAISAQADSPAPVSVQAALDTPSIVMQGEPIILHYSVSNTSSQKVGVHWGSDNAQWYSIQLKDNAGAFVAPIVNKPIPQSEGYVMVQDPFIAAGETRQGDLIITQLFRISQPGRYTLTMHVNLPFMTVADTENSPAAIEKVIGTEGSLLSQDQSFFFTVIPMNSAQLQQKADSIRKTIQSGFSPEQLTLIEALFSMPQTQAYPSWEKLASHPGMNCGLIADELKQVGSAASANLLADMLSNTSLSADNISYVGKCLNEMYNTGSAPLRQHIANIAAVHGISLPKKIAIPVVTD